MQIISRGSLPEDPRATCGKCGTVVSYTTRDIKKGRGERLGERDAFRYTINTYEAYDYLNCPVCNHDIKLRTYTESFEVENW